MIPWIDRRHVLAGLAATAAFTPSFVTFGARSGAISPAMHAALGAFLEANCRYHQAYRALPTGRMVITPPDLSDQWMSANAELRRAAEGVMSVRSTSAKDVRMKMRVQDVFFMKECPPESYWALAEALRWNAVIDREAAAFGVVRPITDRAFA
jgi:hypothetical protein